MEKQEINNAISAQDILCRGTLHKLVKILTIPCIWIASILWVGKLFGLLFMSWDDPGLRYDTLISTFSNAALMLMTVDMWISYTTKVIPIKR